MGLLCYLIAAAAAGGARGIWRTRKTKGKRPEGEIRRLTLAHRQVTGVTAGELDSSGAEQGTGARSCWLNKTRRSKRRHECHGPRRMASTTSMLRKALARLLLLLGGGAAACLLRLVWVHYWLRRRFLLRNPLLDNGCMDNGLLGAMPEVAKNWSRLYDWKVDRFQRFGVGVGKSVVVSRTAFWSPRILVATTNPSNVEHFLSTQFKDFIKSDKLVAVLEPLLGKGIFAINHGPHAADHGAQWRYQRRTASKIFTRNVFQGRMYHTFSDNSQKIVRRLATAAAATAAAATAAEPNAEPIDMQTLMFKFTMDSIGSVGFGVDLNTLDESENSWFANAFDQAQKLTARRFLLPFVHTPLWRLYASEHALRKHIADMDRFSYQVIDERLADPHVGDKTDILSHFVNGLRNEDAKVRPPDAPLSDADTRVLLRDVVMSFFIAGRDTTACLLSFTFLLLSQGEEGAEMQAKLFAEISSELEGQTDAPSLEQLKKGFPYLNGIIMESLRLFPPVPTDAKHACVDTTLPDGTFVPAGASINFEVYAMGRSSEIWGDDYAEVRPERWIAQDGSKVEKNDFAMPVFQPGRRECLGKALALFEAKVLVVELVRKFTFELARKPVDPPYLPGITLTVNGGVPVHTTRRE